MRARSSIFSVVEFPVRDCVIASVDDLSPCGSGRWIWEVARGWSWTAASQTWGCMEALSGGVSTRTRMATRTTSGPEPSAMPRLESIAVFTIAAIQTRASTERSLEPSPSSFPLLPPPQTSPQPSLSQKSILAQAIKAAAGDHLGRSQDSHNAGV